MTMHTKNTVAWLLLLVCTGWGVAPAFAEDEQAPEDADHRAIEVTAETQSLFLYQNDADFDPSEPVYNPDGQGVGGFTTTLSPMIIWNATENIRFAYEAEIGVNVWSTHNPDQQDSAAADALLLKHRQIYAEGELLDRLLLFKAGYQYLRDPTGLFIAHWIGAVTVGTDFGDADFFFTIGQTPDPTYEGVTITETNFKHDAFVIGVGGHSAALDPLDLNLGIWILDDNHRIEHRNNVITPTLALSAELDSLTFGLDAALQLGSFQAGALGGEDQKHLAWAAQLYSILDLTPVELRLNVMALSPDDRWEGNTDNHAFTYSGKSRSSTIMLTEDELRDRWNNLDERLAVDLGGFYLTRPGLLLADLALSWDATSFFEPTLIAGVATVLESENTLGSRFVGGEIALDLRFFFDDILSFNLVGGTLIPGGAAAAAVNSVNRYEMEPQYLVETALTVTY